MTTTPDVVAMDQAPDTTPVDMGSDLEPTPADETPDLEPDEGSDLPAPTCNEEAVASGQITGDTCEADGLSACVTNEDCGAGERCEQPDGKVISCCVQGLPGCKANEEACASSFECEEGQCVGFNGNDEVCTQRCDETHPCPAALPNCNPILGICTTD